MADHCINCGMELRPGAKFCGKCGALTSRSPVGGSVGFAKAEKGVSFRGEPHSSWVAVNRMSQGIALGTDEKIVKQYQIGRYTMRKGSIEVIITNKRAIRFEDSNWLGMKTHRLDEINIDAVHGTSCTMSRSLSILGLVVSGILTIAGIIMLVISLTAASRLNNGNINSFGDLSYAMGRNTMGSGYDYLGLIPIAIAALIILYSLRPSLIFNLYGSIGGPALDTSVNVMGRLFGRNTSSIIFQFKPTEETTVMLREIGALIYDLKTMGDTAIAKWR